MFLENRQLQKIRSKMRLTSSLHEPPPSLFVLSVSSGFFPPKHPEEHGVHVSPGQELHYQ